MDIMVTVEIGVAAPTSTPTSTPTPPGFEAVFAHFLASQKPLLKVLRYCRLAHNRIPRAEAAEVRESREKKD